jgi:RNA polymerase sigma factor (sigma-70 family)
MVIPNSEFDGPAAGTQQNGMIGMEDIFRAAYPWVARAACVLSRAAFRRSESFTIEQADLEQELLLALWSALPKFDSRRASLRTFSELVMRRRLVSLIRKVGAKRRRQLAEFERPDPCRTAPSIELLAGVRVTLDKLSLFDRRLALLLMDCTVAEASRQLKASRSTVYAGIQRLRAAFTAAEDGAQRGHERDPAYRRRTSKRRLSDESSSSAIGTGPSETRECAR